MEGRAAPNQGPGGRRNGSTDQKPHDGSRSCKRQENRTLTRTFRRSQICPESRIKEL